VKVVSRKALLLASVVALTATLFSFPTGTASASTDSENVTVFPNGYATNRGVTAAYPDRVIRFFPSVPTTTRQKFLSVATQYNAAGARLKFGPSTTTRSTNPFDVTIEVVPGPFKCGETLARGCAFVQYGHISGQRVAHSVHIQFGSQILGKPDELKTLLHETGHVFGLGHYEQRYAGGRQVMSTANFAQDKLGAGDINGVRALTRKFDNPFGSLDVVTVADGKVSVAGWAFDSNDPGKNVDVHVYVNGTYSRALFAGLPRTDVRTYLRLSTVNAGYAGEVTRGLRPGLNGVCTYAINVGAGTTNPLLGCRLIVI
jgi:hypothetical protein